MQKFALQRFAVIRHKLKAQGTTIGFTLRNAWRNKVWTTRMVLRAQSYTQTISKATELLLIYQRADKAESEGHIQQLTQSKDKRLTKLEAAVQQVSEQLTALSSQSQPPNTNSFLKLVL